MFKIIRFYNQNRKEIFIVIISMILITLFISKLNASIEKTQIAQEEERRSSEENTTSSFTNQDVKEKELTKDDFYKFEKIVEEFVEYCNFGQTDKAYELVSEDCRNMSYPNLKDFEEQYYKKFFKSKKKYEIKEYSGNIYKIVYVEDMMASGKTENLEKQEDYITYNNESGKLNIGGVIEK